MAIITGGVAVIFDTTIVNVALNDLADELNASLSTIQWVSTGYLLAMFIAIPATGWLQERVGGKRLWIAAQAGFLVGSALCAFAWNAESLIAFRVLQGLAGGVMTPLMITLIMQASRGQALGRLMAVAGLPAALGPILGPVLGGLILSQLTWHWLFLVNVPVCLIGIFLAWRIVPDDRPSGHHPTRKLDVVGLLLLSPGVVGVIYGLSRIGEHGGVGYLDVWLPILFGLALVAAFIGWALRRGPHALLDLRLLRHRPLAMASLLMSLAGLALFGAMFLLPLYFQALRGEDALTAGLILIPQGVGTLLARSLGGRFTDTLGARPVAVTGFAVITLGTLPFAFSGAESAYWWLMLALLVRGMGVGLAMTSLMTVAYVGLERQEMPDASIFTRITQQLGGSFGTALLAMVLTATIVDPTDPSSVAAGFDRAFWWATGLSLVAVGLAFLLPSRRDAVTTV
ncbi:MDR family MFS transporter [Nocardioides insulae]|uniref:MDR family MFS transporter n=1 Tax=Nocardioides insulae TaxID=394734 RepID=UPI0004231E75|nr:MDR family MFS transporter [Nocardioides insulae]